MLRHLGMAWDLRWRTCQDNSTIFCLQKQNVSFEPMIPSIEQVFSASQSCNCMAAALFFFNSCWVKYSLELWKSLISQSDYVFS